MSEQKNDKEVTPEANNEDNEDKKADEVKEAKQVQPEATKAEKSEKEDKAPSEAKEPQQSEPSDTVTEDKEAQKDQPEEDVKEEESASEVAEESVQQVEEKIKEQGFQGDFDFYSKLRDDLPEIKPGDILQVSYRVIEGGKERTQVFEGTVIAIKNKGITKTITVRKTSFGIAVERIFPLNSKLVQKIEIKRHSKVRRAKLYFLRKLKGKAARLKELR